MNQMILVSYVKFNIIHQTTVPYTPQQNGIAERKNKTLKEMVNSMLVSSRAPQNLWGEALLTTNYILNRVLAQRPITLVLMMINSCSYSTNDLVFN